MLMNLLDGWFKMDVGEGAFYAVFGFVFVFLGITLLILFFTLLGKLMDVINKKKAKKAKKAELILPAEKSEDKKSEESEGISPEVVAVISAAIAAYYEGSVSKCDFVVKRIRKI